MTAARPSLPALAGGAALALAAALVLVATPRWQDDTARADRALRQRASVAAAAPAPVPVVSADQHLAMALPPAALLPQRISALVRLAQQHGVRLDSVRQQPALQLGQGAATLAAELVPLRLAGSGDYAAWRRFAAEALQHDDALVLAELRLSRNGPTDRALAGSLQWLLLQRLDDGGGAALAVATRGAP